MIKESISIVLPAYNEQENISKAVENSLNILKEVASEYEVLIVDDGSSDNTAMLSEKMVQQDEHVRVIHHPKNLGYGMSLKTGFSNARSELIFIAPADNQQDMSELKLFLPLIEEADIVAGYRIKRRDPFHRCLNAKVWNFLVRLLFGIKVRDVDWVKLYRKSVFEKLNIEAQSSFMDTEILARAVKAGLRIKEVAVHHYPRTAGKPTGNKPTVVIEAFKDLFKLYRRLQCS